MTLSEFFEKVLPLLLSHAVDRIDKEITIGEIKAYWAGSILRIDIKPREEVNPGNYRSAKGVLPWKEGDELPEDAIRRSWGGGS